MASKFCACAQKVKSSAAVCIVTPTVTRVGVVTSKKVTSFFELVTSDPM